MYVKVIPHLITSELSMLLCILLLLGVGGSALVVFMYIVYISVREINKFTCLFKSVAAWLIIKKMVLGGSTAGSAPPEAACSRSALTSRLRRLKFAAELRNLDQVKIAQPF